MEGFWPRSGLLRRWKVYIQVTALLLVADLGYLAVSSELFELRQGDRPLHYVDLNHRWYLDDYGGWIDLVSQPGVRRDLFPADLLTIVQNSLIWGTTVVICAPFYLLALSAAAEHRETRRRLTAQLCPHCGYDLRATPDRCPECGRVQVPVRTRA